jgi:hypothetical protein
MPRRADTNVPEPLSPSKEEPPESVTLGVGSRCGFAEEDREPQKHCQLRGLLPVPPEVEAEVRRQEAQHPMAPEYRKILRDRLTLGHYFEDVEIAFRRTPDGVEVLAAGLDEIAAFRRTTQRDERHGVIYGVG